MRKKNGTTIVEILISVCLIAIVLALIFNLLIQVKNEDVSNQTQSVFLIDQASIIKEVEEDMIDYGVKNISSCEVSEANIGSVQVVSGFEDKFKCVKIEYSADYTEDTLGFLMIYKTYSKYVKQSTGDTSSSEWVVQYVRGHYENFNPSNGSPIYSSWKNETQTMRGLPDEIDLSEAPYISYTASATTTNAGAVVIPIIDGQGEHYDINLGFTFAGTNTSNFTCKNIHKNSKQLQCKCLSGTALCNKTY